MPKVYILPDIYIYDRDVPANFYRGVTSKPTANKYAQIVGDWQDQLFGNCSEHDYTIFLDGCPIEKNKPYGKINHWGLFSFDVTPGDHTITVTAYQQSMYDDTRLRRSPMTQERLIKFQEGYDKKKHTFEKTIKFNVKSGNAFFHFLLGFEQYYPILWAYEDNAPVRIPGYELTSHDYTSHFAVFFHDKYVKYAVNHMFKFEQMDLAKLKYYMADRARRENCNAYNEPVPAEDGVTNLTTVKPVQKSTKGKTDNNENMPDLARQAKEAGKTIAQFIADRPQAEKPRKKIVKKEVTINVKYFDSAEFLDAMQNYDYEVLDRDAFLDRTVVLKGIKTPQAEIIVPDGVTIVKKDVFGEYLDKVTFVKLPFSVTKIDAGAFANNKTIQKVEIASRVSVIGEKTFFGCTNLCEAKLSPYVKEIKSKAFAGTKLKKIFLPYNTKIAKDAFDDGVEIIFGTQKQIDIEKQVMDALVAEVCTDKTSKDKLLSIQKRFEQNQSKLKNEFEQPETKKAPASKNKTNELEKEILELKNKIELFQSTI